MTALKLVKKIVKLDEPGLAHYIQVWSSWLFYPSDRL